MRARSYRRRKDPLIGSPARHKSQCDGLTIRREIDRDIRLEEREVEAVSRDLRANNLTGLYVPDPALDPDNFIRGRRPTYRGPEPPGEVFDPVYEELRRFGELYDGLEIEETYRPDAYRMWIAAGKPRSVDFGGTFEVPVLATRTRRLRVKIEQIDLEKDLRRHLHDIYGSVRPQGDDAMTTEVISRLERIEQEISESRRDQREILARLGDDAAIGGIVDDLIADVNACGVQPFADD